MTPWAANPCQRAHRPPPGHRSHPVMRPSGRIRFALQRPARFRKVMAKTEAFRSCRSATRHSRRGKAARRPDRRRAATLSVAWRTSCRVTTPARRQQPPRRPASLASTSDRASGILLARHCVGGKSWAAHRGSTQAAVVIERRTTSYADAIPPTLLRRRRGPAWQNRISGSPQPVPRSRTDIPVPSSARRLCAHSSMIGLSDGA